MKEGWDESKMLKVVLIVFLGLLIIQSIVIAYIVNGLNILIEDHIKSRESYIKLYKSCWVFEDNSLVPVSPLNYSVVIDDNA